MNVKLTQDLCLLWLQQTVKNYRLLSIVFLLTVPISALFHFQQIESSYLDATFAGLKKNSPILNVTLNDHDNYVPVEYYLTEELSLYDANFTFSYERTARFFIRENQKQQARFVSFFSGGYEELSIEAELGALKPLNFTAEGAPLIAAVTYDYWSTVLQKTPDIIGEQLIVNQKAVTIVAVLSHKTKSFRKNLNTSIVIPYNQFNDVQGLDEHSLTPDTYSYLLGAPKDINSIIEQASVYLQNEALITDDTKLAISEAFGVAPSHYLQVKARLQVLNLMFTLLFLFCLVAFIAFYSDECSLKQQEIKVRSLCGALNIQLDYQRFLEIFLTVLLIAIICLFTLPIVSYLLQSFFPSKLLVSVTWQFASLVQLFAIIVSATFILIFAIFYFQEKFIKTTIGRGESVSLGQQIQSYLLLAILMTVTVVTVYITTILLQSQYALNNTNFGFTPKNRFFVSFSNDNLAQRVFHADNSPQLLLSRLADIERVGSIAIVSMPPLSTVKTFGSYFTVTGETIGSGKSSNTLTNIVSPGYFETLGTKFTMGRTLSWNNMEEVVVNQALWDKYFSNSTLAQATLLSRETYSGEMIPSKIVGVVNNIYYDGPDTSPLPLVYSLNLVITGFENLVVNYQGNASDLQKQISTVVEGIDLKLKNAKVESAENLVLQEGSSRKAILMISLVTTFIVALSSIAFAISTIRQLSLKNSRDLSVRYSLGAMLSQIVTTELIKYFCLFVPLILATVVLGVNKLTLLKEYVVNVELFDFGLFVTIFCAISIALVGIFIHQLKKITKQSWYYLT